MVLENLVQRYSEFDHHLWEYPFWTYLVPRFETVSLKWNLLLRLTRMFRAQWWCSLFSVFDQKYPVIWVRRLIRICRVLSQFDPKNEIVEMWNFKTKSWNLVRRLIQIGRIQWCRSLFFRFRSESSIPQQCDSPIWKLLK